MAIVDGNDIIASDFIKESERNATPANDANRVPKLESDARISGYFLYKFGDGSDGNVTISSPTTLTRDMYYDNLTVNSTLTTDGYKVFVRGTLSGNGTIDYGIPNNGSNGSGITGGAGGTQSGSGVLKTIAGSVGGGGGVVGGANATVGGTGTDGHIGANNSSILGGTGGNSNETGKAGGAGGNNITKYKFGIERTSTILISELTDTGMIVRKNTGAGGGGGGGKGNNAGESGGGGGGGGASGGVVFIACRFFTGTFTIKSIGGNGGAGANGSNDGGGGGGGAGGNGGISIVVYAIKTWTGSYNIVGGSGGAGGLAGANLGQNPQNGAAGSSGGGGTYHEILIGDLL